MSATKLDNEQQKDYSSLKSGSQKLWEKAQK